MDVVQQTWSSGCRGQGMALTICTMRRVGPPLAENSALRSLRSSLSQRMVWGRSRKIISGENSPSDAISLSDNQVAQEWRRWW